MVLGLIRSRLLRRTDLIGTYAGADHILLGQLALLGPFSLIPEALFFRRMHAKRSTKMYPLHARIGWYDPSAAGRVVFPYWKLLIEFRRVFRASALHWHDKARCYGALAIWVLREREKLAADLLHYPRQWMKRSGSGPWSKWGWLKSRQI
jgi:hypothetical protein